MDRRAFDALKEFHSKHRELYPDPARSLTAQKHTMRELDLQMLATLEESLRRDHQQKLLNLCKPEKCSAGIIATERLQPSCANLCCPDPTEWAEAKTFAALHLHAIKSARTGARAAEFEEIQQRLECDGTCPYALLHTAPHLLTCCLALW